MIVFIFKNGPVGDVLAGERALSAGGDPYYLRGGNKRTAQASCYRKDPCQRCVCDGGLPSPAQGAFMDPSEETLEQPDPGNVL